MGDATALTGGLVAPLRVLVLSACLGMAGCDRTPEPAVAVPAPAATPAPVLGASQAPDVQQTAEADCPFVVPAGWPSGNAKWSGPCRDGLANGRGTLRVYQGSQVVRSFFGDVRNGALSLGVIDLPDEGFVAGRFEAGQPVADGDRNTLIEAFDVASEAARGMATTFRQAGNTASADYYESKAETLARQLD
jgi:hypothetical protein